MKALFLTTSPLNFNISQVALDTERAIWKYRTDAGMPTTRENFRIHEGDVKMIILTLEKNDLMVVPREILMQLLELHRKHGGTVRPNETAADQEGGDQ